MKERDGKRRERGKETGRMRMATERRRREGGESEGRRVRLVGKI